MEGTKIVSSLPMGSELMDLFEDPWILLKLHPNAFPHVKGLRPEGMSMESYFKLIVEREPITNMQVSLLFFTSIHSLQTLLSRIKIRLCKRYAT
jgi:hypothetical protein